MKPDEILTTKAIQRITDYGRVDYEEERKKLVELWRKVHPVAAQEQSAYLHPLMLMEKYEISDHDKHPDEIWFNDIYNVTVRFHKQEKCFGTDGPMVQLGISALDGTARHDWREMMAIKNQLAGAETEAFELYPATSRELDPSNYYSLWCFPGIKRIKVGIDLPRRVWDADVAMAPQRALAKPPEGETGAQKP
jgi:hypothetical protein